jgi:hypothetical protein
VSTLNGKPVVAAELTTFVSATNAGVTLDGTSVDQSCARNTDLH